MANKPLPCPTLLRQLLRYEPETGKLFWKERPVWMFKDGGKTALHQMNAWNSRHATKEAFTASSTLRYRHGTIFDAKAYAHRVIWKLSYGTDPVEVDHIDGDRSNNKLSNLRNVSKADNAKNKRPSSRNTSGSNGVCWSKACGKWKAEIQCSGVRKHLGVYANKSDAIFARKSAEILLGFHKNHGV
jgi:hypothetical protein